MFCLKCGKELPDSAKFCAFCGKVIPEELQQPQEQKSSEVSTPSQSSENTSQDSSIAEGKVQQQKSSILQKKKSIVIIGVAVALVVAVVVGVFSVRANNERDMIRQIPWMVYNDETSNKIRAYYEDYLGKNLAIGCGAEDFSVEQGSDSNTFDFVGKIEVTDLSQDSRPTYFVNVTGTVTTNFFRTKYHLTYQLAYEEPEVKFVVPSIDIDVDFFDFLGTYADIYDSANTLEANAAPSTVLITGYSGYGTVFSTGLSLTDLAFEERTPRNRVYCSDDYDTGLIILTFVPASYSQFGVDTIYMESEDFPNAIYTRTGYEYTNTSDSGYDSGPYIDDPTMIVDMRELENAFASNTYSAENVYGGKCIAVVGEIDSVMDTGSAVRVSLSYASSLGGKYHELVADFWCERSNTYSLYDLSIGQVVVIAGYLDKVWGSGWIEFRDCYIF